MSESIKLFVGLGNPGPKYTFTRHNIGFIALDHLASRWNFSYKPVQKGLLAQGTVDGQKIILLKPMTYMNLSGESVLPIKKFYQIDLDDIYVLHDDVDLEPWRIKTKKGGGAGGHNGLKSLDQWITKQYWRIRIGVGRPPEYMDTADYVLAQWKEVKDSYDLDSLVNSLEGLVHSKPDKWLNELYSQSSKVQKE